MLPRGRRPSAYYASIFTTYGTQFILIGLVEAALLGPTIFPHCSSSLVVLTFLLFGCGAVAFGLALSPFFPTARIAALVGPLIFFLTSLLYFLFLDGTTLNQGDVGGKWLSSLFPAMAFYLGASRMAQLEDGDSGVTCAHCRGVEPLPPPPSPHPHPHRLASPSPDPPLGTPCG